jgi:hypothetical protein
LCRRRLFGWYVRLLTSFSPYWFRAATPGRDGSAHFLGPQDQGPRSPFGWHRPPTR